MNPFEKIFNYQLITRLDDSGTSMVTAQERSWLKTMLQQPEAEAAFTPETLEKLRLLLEPASPIDFSGHLVEKAGNVEVQVYHPLLRPLRRLIRDRAAASLSFSAKSGGIYNKQLGLPYKLEYSMVKKEWYLLWYHLRTRRLMSTRLQKIDSAAVHPQPITAERYDQLQAEIRSKLEELKVSATVEVVREYNAELSRILYAFSPFEKEVLYDDEEDVYRLVLSFSRGESEYMLSKIRFLGKRVRIVDNAAMHRRMYESASMALARYGVTADECEGDAAAEA